MNWDLVISVLWKSFAVLVLVFLNGFFVAAEFALVKVRDTQLDPLAAKGHRRALTVKHIHQHLDAYLSAAQLGITLASLGLGWIGEPIFEDLLHPVFGWLNVESEAVRKTVAFAVGFSTITFLHIVAGEQAPKSFGIRQPLVTALFVAYPMRWFHAAAYPFIWILNESSLWLLRRLGVAPAHEGSHSEDELRLLLASAQRGRTSTPFGRNVVINALDLRQRIVREVMRPRQELVCLDLGATTEVCLEIAERTRYSRFPLAEEGDPDRTVGVVHIKDLFAMRQKARTGADLVPVARKLIYVAETAPLEKLLHVFLDRRLHMAVVVDEYGGTTGLITLENILEEIVGQIQDEFDQEKPLFKRINDGEWEIDGALPIHDLAELTGQSIEEEEVTTTSGLVTQRAGGFPKEGDVLALGAFELRVEALDGPRVTRLRLLRKAVEQGAAPSV